MRLIDADKLSNELATVCDDRYDRTVEWCIKVLQQAPTVDAVEVVRCKDCIDWDKDGFCGITGREEPESHYCSYGEREENVD